jgi:2-oxo-3-hexenedioate decarboxylase/2-keto-4-pentenoate hydratase
MPTAFDPEAAARWLAEQHETQQAYQNLPGALAPATVDDAYAVQEAFARLWTRKHGEVAGMKIATTTKVMQALMGIDQPTSGMIFARRVHAGPASLQYADYISLMAECELAVRLDRDLPARPQPTTREEARAAVGAVLPAFELIEDRRAHYKSTKALSLIADNAWNCGIVVGPDKPVPKTMELNGLTGRLSIDGVATSTGPTDDPMGALAWLADLAAHRGRQLKAGQIVITGSIIATFPVEAGKLYRLTIDGVGETEMTAV